MDDQLVAVCASCSQLHPDGFRCACIVARAEILAALQHEHRRTQLPGWRRPRLWELLPERVRQQRTEGALDIVEALEAGGWRLVSMVPDGRHMALEDVETPPTGSFRVPDVVR